MSDYETWDDPELPESPENIEGVVGDITDEALITDHKAEAEDESEGDVEAWDDDMDPLEEPFELSAETRPIEGGSTEMRGYSSTATAANLSLMAKIEAILFASPKCMKTLDIFEVLEDPDLTIEAIEAELQSLVETYRMREGGFRLDYIRGHGYQFRTVPEAGCYMERLFATRPRPLSRAALETLSIVAYRQPVSRADIEFIRGVDSGSIVKNLLERGLIRCVGRNEEVAGKPMVFGTGDEFLNVFRLNSLADLPPLASFQPPQELLEEVSERFDEEASEDDTIEEGDFVGVQGEEDPEISEGILADSEQEAGESEEEDVFADLSEEEREDEEHENEQEGIPLGDMDGEISPMELSSADEEEEGIPLGDLDEEDSEIGFSESSEEDNEGISLGEPQEDEVVEMRLDGARYATDGMEEGDEGASDDTKEEV